MKTILSFVFLALASASFAGSQARGGGALPYKVYSALLTQAGTDAPVAIVLENTLGVTFTWNYIATGNYSIDADSGTPFTADKTTVIVGSTPDSGSPGIGTFGTRTDTQIQIWTRISGNGLARNNDYLHQTFFEIRVYP